MAENENGTEKTEDPTGRKLEKAREEGQVPRSKELVTTLMLVLGAAAILLYGTAIGKALENVLIFNFVLERDDIYDTRLMTHHLVGVTKEIVVVLLPFMLMLLIASIVGNVALGGFLFSVKALAPKFNKLNPIAGIKRMFSVKALMELVKGIAKTLVVGVVAWLVMLWDLPELRVMGSEDVRAGIGNAAELLAWTFLFLSSSLILIAAMDVPFQAIQHQKDLRMTKQEVKDEYRDTEGKPEVKSRIRQLQYDMAQRRMLQDVPKADVVITNPDHYSVALRYDSKKHRAPIVVARGVDHMAFRIREIAKANGVELVACPPLTRAVYYHTEIGGEVPAGLYMAVAQVLAYVFQLRRFRRGWGDRPGGLPSMNIPPDLRRD